MSLSIKGMPKAEVLRRLYNGGFNDINHGPITGKLQRLVPPMTLEEAQAHIDACLEAQSGFARKVLYFDYVAAKCLKVDITGDELDQRLYDRDCGQGAAARALGLSDHEDVGGVLRDLEGR